MSQEKVDQSRRKALNVLLGGAGLAFLGSVAYPVVRYLIPPKLTEAAPTTLKIAAESEIAPNTAIMFKYGRTPGLLIRTADGDLKAFNAECTHLDCTVQYRPEEGVIWCACHNGRYDLNGQNISGPPPRPLTPFAVNVKDGEIYVSQQEA